MTLYCVAMTGLIRCGACDRHLRRDEAVCPFCAAEITDEARRAEGSSVPRGASRAQRYAARAALIAGTAAVAACGGAKKNDDTTTTKVDPVPDPDPVADPDPDPDSNPPPPTPYGCVWADEDADVVVV